MVDITEVFTCTGCGACVNICPIGCIQMESDREGFGYPKVDTERCIHCGRCEKVCPVDGERAKTDVKNAYAVYNRDAAIRAASSSGGVFTAVAEYVIDCGGVVFGAKLDEDLCVRHGYTESAEGLAAFRGSKYVQSDIGYSFRSVKEYLEKGRLVLFSGTPCQIGGLYGYLGKQYDNLICLDIICHGVPSPLAWQKYLEDRSRQYRAKPYLASFRDKSNGWVGFSMRLNFKNGAAYTLIASRDGFMKSFLGDYCLRPSCYHCAFKQDQRQADITLADFWGIDQVVPEMNDDRGISLILVHSRRGQELLDKLENKLERRAVDWNKAITLNPAINHSATAPERRKDFMEAILQGSFDRAVRKYCEPSLANRVKAWGYKLLRGPGWLKNKLLGRA